MTPSFAEPPRLDLFTPIHKALRRLLFTTAVSLGRTDFASNRETTQAEAAVATCFEFCREHAEHEDHHVLPDLARLSPELALRLAAQHPHLERAAIAVESLWPRLPPLPADRRRVLGGELARRFHGFVAAELQHMDGEERDVNALLWTNLSDEQLVAISDRIRADLSPRRLRIWREMMMPALSGPEVQAIEARRPRTTSA